MRYLTFTEREEEQYEIAFLLPNLNKEEIHKHYIEPYLLGRESEVIAYNLYKAPKKTPVKLQKEYLNELLPILMDQKVKYLVVCDGDYFKTLTKSRTVDAGSGYVLDCVVGDFKVVYCPNFQQVFYDPDRVRAKIFQGMTALVDYESNKYADPGKDIIHAAAYPQTADEIAVWLQRLLDMDVSLTADIETFSLKHFDAGIGTITFCWNKHEGVAFPVDLGPEPEKVRALLKDFFIKFRRKMIWHNITFDVYVLVYQLFMENILDTKGLLYGLEVLLRDWDDTKLITYLATNSCSGNKLGLKAQAQEYAGNYAIEEIKDITTVPLDDLLQYNLIDGLSTWYVYEKHLQTMLKDNQDDIYQNLFKKAVVDIIQMQLTGLPIDMDEVLKAQKVLEADAENSIDRITNSPVVEAFIYDLNLNLVAKKNAAYKKKRITMADVDEKFNPNSAPQLQRLLYEENFMDLPVLDLTDSKLPATGAETLEKLKNHTDDPDKLAFLDALIDYKAVAIILSTFIPAFLRAAKGPDGWHYLFGNFNLGGTLSGRLSSNNPNLQNLPSSGTKYAKIIKTCFKAPPGWLFVGLDFDSLEDKISALTTKDPMKLKVYTDGYDGHCLRAYFYFKDQMPDIDPDSVESINSIAKKYKPERQKSKAPTFALTYQGTYVTLMNNCGFTETVAKQIEDRYHELYEVSDKWVQDKLETASKTGFVEVAFGLRVRTPLLKQVILGNRQTPYEAEKEGRTAGNALGQSWCLLNTRAGIEFMELVRKGEFKYVIKPCAHIHDAQYYLIPDDMEVVQYMNKHLVNAVRWQNHPDIAHNQVKMSGALDIFYPNWNTNLTIPNEANANEIATLAKKHFEQHCA